MYATMVASIRDPRARSPRCRRDRDEALLRREQLERGPGSALSPRAAARVLLVRRDAAVPQVDRVRERVRARGQLQRRAVEQAVVEEPEAERLVDERHALAACPRAGARRREEPVEHAPFFARSRPYAPTTLAAQPARSASDLDELSSWRAGRRLADAVGEPSSCVAARVEPRARRRRRRRRACARARARARDLGERRAARAAARRRAAERGATARSLAAAVGRAHDAQRAAPDPRELR